VKIRNHDNFTGKECTETDHYKGSGMYMDRQFYWEGMYRDRQTITKDLKPVFI
jgi:hypothetical protein